MADHITFPAGEHSALKGRILKGQSIYTTRISAEKGRYKKGNIYDSDLGYPLKVTDVVDYPGGTKHPFADELSPDQLKEIGKNPYDLVRMERASQLQKAAADKGIPDRKEYGDLSKVEAGKILDYFVQKHKADRAGEHYDLRFGTPETGLYSWAVRKGIPEPGDKPRLAVMQPSHSHSYGPFEGTIRHGYGKGTVAMHDKGSVLIDRADDKNIRYTIGHTRYPERFLLRQAGEDAKKWLLINSTPTKAIPYDKKHMKTIPPEKSDEVFESMKPGTSVQPKIDGAAGLTQLLKDKPEVASYRTSKVNDRPILYTERMFHKFPEATYPKKYVGSVLRGEVYGEKNKETIRPQELGGLLNSSVTKSIKDQERGGVKIKKMVFDVQQVGHKKIDPDKVPYEARMKMVHAILKHLPKDSFTVPFEAKTAPDARKLLQQIKDKKHPETYEGVVVHPPTGNPEKIKFTDEHDVHIRDIFKGEGKYDKDAGGFSYSLTAKGPIVGKVGTGISDKLRTDLMKGKDSYVGRVARIRAQEQLPSGAFRAPSLIALHEDLPMKKKAEEVPVEQPKVKEDMPINGSKRVPLHEAAAALERAVSYKGKARNRVTPFQAGRSMQKVAFPQFDFTNPMHTAAAGTLLGGAAGALLNKKDRLKGALIGAGVGGLAGGGGSMAYNMGKGLMAPKPPAPEPVDDKPLPVGEIRSTLNNDAANGKANPFFKTDYAVNQPHGPGSMIRAYQGMDDGQRKTFDTRLDPGYWDKVDPFGYRNRSAINKFVAGTAFDGDGIAGKIGNMTGEMLNGDLTGDSTLGTATRLGLAARFPMLGNPTGDMVGAAARAASVPGFQATPASGTGMIRAGANAKGNLLAALITSNVIDGADVVSRGPAAVDREWMARTDEAGANPLSHYSNGLKGVFRLPSIAAHTAVQGKDIANTMVDTGQAVAASAANGSDAITTFNGRLAKAGLADQYAAKVNPINGTMMVVDKATGGQVRNPLLAQ